VLDLTGRVIFKESFSQQFEWGGVNQSGNRLPIGIYVVRVIQQGVVVQQRVVIE
jgi:hypothetical protein